MPSTIIVNFLTTQHKSSVGITAAFPDVCKTPAPPAPAPVPIPYPNVGSSSMASDKVTKKVSDNKQKVIIKGSSYTMTSGDEPGVALGIISSKIKGKSEIMNQSFNVKFEGKGVGRLTDPHGNNSGSKPNVPSPAEVQPPTLGMPGMAPGQKEACKEVDKKRVEKEDRAKVAEECGMAAEHAESISTTCEYTKHSATFRSTNSDSLNKIKAGYPAKGCDIPEKTISAKSVKDSATMTFCEKHDLKGFVGHYEKVPDGKGGTKAGKLLGVKTTDGFTALADIPPPAKNSYTGDYDAHDMFGRGGKRIKDGTLDESKFQRSLNRGIGRGDPGPAKDMVRHGPQNNYKDYYDREGKKKGKEFVPSLTKPDISPKEPLLAFDENGEMYKLETEDDLRNYYECKGQETPEEWGERTEVPPDKKDHILKGERGKKKDGTPNNDMAGGHSADILTDSDYATEVLSVNPNGTKVVKFSKQLPDGNVSKIKKSTLYPDSWDSDKIMGAAKSVGNKPPHKPPRMNKDGSYSTFHKGVVDGVEVEVVKNGNKVATAYPTGF